MNKKQLIDEANKLLQEGKSLADIRDILLEKGFDKNLVEEALAAAKKSTNISSTEKQTEVNLFRQLIRTVFVISAILLGGGLIAILASYWPSMYPSWKLALTIFGMLTFYLTGWFLSIKKREERISEALFLLGALVYGGAFFLAGQVFHVKINLFWALHLWVFGALALAVLVKAFILFYLALLINFVAIVAHGLFFLQNREGNSIVLPLIAGLVFILLGLALKGPKELCHQQNHPTKTT